MKIFFIAPHLSTGGMPQYLFKQIEALYKEHEVYCIEWDDVTGGQLVVQRNRIKNILGSKLITLDQDKYNLFKLIKEYKPDVVHLQEIPEMFMSYEVATKLYSQDRTYKIVETSHDSSYDTTKKCYFPDKFMMVSQYQIEAYKSLNIPIELVEYPIEYKKRTNTREELLNRLGLDPNKKHVINVGLFTPRKNQAEVIEYAKQLQDYPIQFHFIGNQADNFKYYSEPLMKDFPTNCKWWGERDDVDTFFEMADLFLFTSRGHATDKETMPLVIREAISWKAPSLIFNLDVYLNYFDTFTNIDYLDFNNKGQNIKLILNKVGMEINKVDEIFDLSINAPENKINIQYKKQEPVLYKVSIKEKYSNAPLYWFNANFENNSSWWVIPIPTSASDFSKDYAIGTILVEFYDLNNNLVFSKDLFIKDSDESKTRLNLDNPFDCLFNNYNEMFLESKYDCYELDNMDIVFDIGANSGLFSLLCINKGVKKVYSFEPNKDSLINLKSVTNNLNVEIVPKAVYTKDEDLKFYIDPSNTTIGSLSKNHLELHGSSLEEVVVPAISLKTFAKENNIDKISLVKMDIEGAEYEIIDNLEDEVFEIIDNFLIEYHDNDDERVLRLTKKLIQKGFNIDQIRDQNSKDNIDIKKSYNKSPIGTIFAKKSNVDKLLTVIIPTYNHEKYVEKTIDSVLMQKTLFAFNILVSDDCSTDRTWEVLQKYKGIPGLTITKTPKNQGSTAKRFSNLLSSVKSDYITILDGDDYYTDENKLQKQIEFLKDNPKYSIHSTGYFQKEKESDENLMDYVLYGIKEHVELENNMVANYVSFGFMFKNIFKDGYKFPEWFFNEDVFDHYWAINCLLLEKGKCRNERWGSGVYRITPNGQYGEKDQNWKKEVGLKQSQIISEAYKDILEEINNPKIKPIIIIDAFFHNENCLNTFKKHLSLIKNLDVPIMLVTNSKFEQSLIKEVDYIFYDNNNRLFKKSYSTDENVFLWYSDSVKYFSISEKITQKHGLSVLSNLYHSTNLAKSLGYTHFFRFEYDSYFDNLTKIKDMINIVKKEDKKGLIYVNEKKYVSFQLWYFELEHFTSMFPKLNNENDYNSIKSSLGFDENYFLTAEEFVFNLIKKHDEQKLIVKDAPEIYKDFPNASWNSIISPAESKQINNGLISSVFKVAKKIFGIEDQFSPVDNNKFAVVTWNCSTSKENKSLISIKRKDSPIELITHNVSGDNGHQITLFDLDDLNVEVKIEIDKNIQSFTINKNNIHLVDNIVTFK
jgi:FkbM family methyltransferase